MTSIGVVYLHGFASGPSSKKARFFGERFAARNIRFTVPDLASGDFSHLTLSGQLRVIKAAAAAAAGPVCLMGSSMGGYLAALHAAAHPGEVEKLVLLAPAFDFAARWRERLSPAEFAAWERTGALSVFHYSEGRSAEVGFALYTDALQYEPFPAVTGPTLVFHGRRDNVVPPELSERFAAGKPHARVRLFDSDHELVDVTEEMWEETWAFFQH